MKKFLLSIFAMFLAFANLQAEEVTVYTLEPAEGSNNSYASNCDIAIGDITWNLTGNSQMIPWRIGGKNITDVDRTLYSKNPMAGAVDKVVLSIGTVNSITVNSAKLLVADNADFTNAVETPFTVTANSDSEIAVTAPAGSYYKFVFNVTVSGSSNRFIQISKAVFYSSTSGETTAAAAPSLPADCSFTESKTIEITNNEVGATVYYTTDGENFNEYVGEFTINETTTVKAYAQIGDDVATKSFEVTRTYTKLEAKTIAEVIEAGVGETYTKGTVVATYAKGFLLNDETGYILVYQGNAPTVAEGDVININGKTSMYGGLLQFAADANIEKTGTAEVTHPEAVVMDGAAFDAFLTAPEVKYVEYIGTLTINGNYYNVAVEGAETAIASIQYPNDGLVTVESGEVIKVTGYTIGYNKSFVNTMAVKVEAYVEPTPEPEEPAAGIEVGKHYRIKSTSNGDYLTIGDTNDNQYGHVHGAALDEANDNQVFTFIAVEGQENTYYVQSVAGKYFSYEGTGAGWNVNGTDDATKAHALTFEAAEGELQYLIKCYNASKSDYKYFKYEYVNASGKYHPFNDADLDKAEVWTLEEAAVEPEPEVPFEVVAVTPTEAVEELTTVTVEFSEEIEGTFDMMGMTQIYLGTRSNGCSFEVNGKVLTITPFNAINTPGEYKLVIPEGLITRKSNGEAVTMNGEYVFTVKEAVVEPEPEEPATVVITSVDQLSNDKLYTIVSKDTGRGGMFAGEGATLVDMCGVTYNDAQACHSIERDANDPRQQFAFVNYEGKFYLYSVSEKKFVAKDGNVNKLTAEAPFDYITVALEAESGGDYFSLFINDANYITASPGWCSNASRNTCIQTTLTSKSQSDGWDDGAWFTITQVGDFDATEALALLSATPEPEAPFEVVAVTPTEAVAELTTVTVEFSEEIEGTFDMMGMTQIYLGTRSNGCSFEVNGKVLTITPFNAINTPGEYKLVIPEGLITRKSNGEAVTMNGEYVFTVKEAEAPFEVVAVTPTEAVEELTTVTVEFSEEIEGTFDMMGMTQIYLGTRSNGCSFEVNGKVLTITPFNAINTPGEYKLVIPEGLITRKSNGEAVTMNGEYVFTVKEATVEPEPEVIPAANKSYTVVAEGHTNVSRPQWAINDEGTAFVSTGNTTVSTDAQKQFAFVTYEEAIYIYSISAKKFVMKDASLSDKNPDAVQLTELDNGKFFFKFDADHNVNIGGSGQMAIDWWSTIDGGNQFTLTEAGDFDATEALALLNTTPEPEAPFEVVAVTPTEAVAELTTVTVEFSEEIEGTFDMMGMTQIYLGTRSNGCSFEVNGKVLTITPFNAINTPGEYKLVIPEGLITRKSNGEAVTMNGEYVFTVKEAVVEPERFTVTAALFPTVEGDVTEIKGIRVEAGQGPALAELPTGWTLTNEAGDEFEMNIQWLYDYETILIMVNPAITEAGTYTLTIPAGSLKTDDGKECEAAEFSWTIKDPYMPYNNGTRTNTGRVIRGITLTAASGENSYTLTDDEQTQDYTDATAVAVFQVEVGEELTITFDKAGEWIHQFVFIDFDGDGFTASIAEGSEWAPAGDLVAYSFYNNDSSSDENGWNSVGTSITGNDRSTPAVPAFKAPESAGTYRMRVKQDWCNIDPAGDADGKFGDFKANGGQIIDLTLEVIYPIGIESVESENVNVKGIYDITGRKIEKITEGGIYIVNGKKVLVK